MSRKTSKDPKEHPRRVRLCRHTADVSGPGENGRSRDGRPILYAFSWADLGALLGLRPETARKLARAGRFDPSDLASVAAFWHERSCDHADLLSHVDLCLRS